MLDINGDQVTHNKGTERLVMTLLPCLGIGDDGQGNRNALVPRTGIDHDGFRAAAHAGITAGSRPSNGPELNITAISFKEGPAHLCAPGACQAFVADCRVVSHLSFKKRLHRFKIDGSGILNEPLEGHPGPVPFSLASGTLGRPRPVQENGSVLDHLHDVCMGSVNDHFRHMVPAIQSHINIKIGYAFSQRHFADIPFDQITAGFSVLIRHTGNDFEGLITVTAYDTKGRRCRNPFLTARIGHSDAFYVLNDIP